MSVYTRLERLSTFSCVEAKEQIDQHIRDNRSISSKEITWEVNIIYGKKLCKTGLRSIRKHFILMESETLETVLPDAPKDIIKVKSV
jgi:hypothetical protein